MTKILMIEDDLELAEILTEYLEPFDMSVTVAEDPYIGLSTLDMHPFDLLILDLTLPGIDGLDVCKEIRKRHTIPIIISSARTDITDKVTALENGADDYLPKPYNPRELQARIMSLLRRNKGLTPIDQNVQKTKDLVLNEEQRTIVFHGKALPLTAAEYGILGYLIKKEGGVVSREELIYNIEAISEETTNKSIDVIIGRIRQKLGENPKEPTYIHAIRGIGYKFLQ
ncbi:MAG: response regulator transcription factor [Sulfurospirillum cavolei]|jgi:two-component system OmpR family response regulator|uniref:response regulator transcription factor n=1 Tax=Sulfurospirillum TaxID=57665 RepID=UPI000543A9F6|nr:MULTISPECIES: response regulator transcription factor [Sulfurospirillum]KHG34290.1 MAG: chemotaxis protein CheY [Sulfurospirillum sp. MES]MDY0264114.1 response regulator transcription factor [Sulfurospirillum cavolei]